MRWCALSEEAWRRNKCSDPRRPHCVVLSEDEVADPCEEEIESYARSIGIDPETEPQLMCIAREGVRADVPRGWQILQDREGRLLYQQKCTGVCIWEHPLDAQFRLRVVEAREKAANRMKTAKEEQVEEEKEKARNARVRAMTLPTGKC